jgi:phosphatidylinositol-3-phosphatase
MRSQAVRARKIIEALILICCVLLFASMLACGGGSSSFGIGGGTFGGGGGGTGSGGGGTGGGGGSGGIPPVQYFAIVVVENSNYSDIVGSPNAPYINALIAQGGLAANYYANVHPSIGNYFVMTTGVAYSTDDNFSGVVPIDNVVRELGIVSKSWKVYAQSLPSQGYLGGDVYPYLRRHNPISYFSDVQPPSQLNMNIVDFSQLSADLSNNQLPSYSFLVPDAEHDAHDCPGGGSNCDIGTRVAAADTWLSNNLPQLLSNPQFQQNGILVITTDESRNDITNGGGRVATVILGSHVKVGYVGTVLYDHRSLLGLSMAALGVSAIPNGAGVANQMTEFFQ